jgi:hypothetical protein
VTRGIGLGLGLPLFLAVAQGVPGKAAEGVPVAIELVLAIDCSFSVNDAEYALQMKGIAAALRDPEVVGLIDSHADGIAMTLFHWAGTANNKQAVPWARLKERDSIEAFAAEVEAAPRSPLGYFTAIGHAIAFGVKLIEENEFDGRERKIDVSGDGRSNSGPEPREMRLAAFLRGITINGLAVTGGDDSIASYYASQVVIGPSSFVLKAEGYGDFAAAFKRKLLRELRPHVAGRE